MKSKQLATLERLLTRKRGATSMEIITEVGTVSPHRRLADLMQKGWGIYRKAVEGKRHGVYFGCPPKT